MTGASEPSGENGPGRAETAAEGFKGRGALLIALIVLFCLAAYANSLGGPFMLDDGVAVTLNRPLMEMEPNLPSFFRAVFGGVLAGRPFSAFTYAVNRLLWGGDVRAYHAFNLLVHLLAAWGVFSFVALTLRRLGRPDGEAGRWAFAIALLWALNPVQVQSVSYVAQRMSALSGLFLFWSLYFHGKSREEGVARGRRRRLSLSLLLFFFALASKETALSLAVLLPWWERCTAPGPAEADWRSVARRAAPYWLLAAAALAFFLTRIARFEPQVLDPFGFSASGAFSGWGWERKLVLGRALTLYASLVLFPAPSRLCFDHPLRFEGAAGVAASLLSLLFWGLFLAWVLKISRRRPLIALPAGWFLLGLLPESLGLNLTPFQEHRLYLPSLGAAGLIVLGLGRLPDGRFLPGRRLLCAVVALALIFTFLVHERNKVWGSVSAMGRDRMAKAPGRTAPLLQTAAGLVKEGRAGEAEDLLNRALKLNPRCMTCLLQRAVFLHGRGRYAEASADLEAYVSLMPEDVRAWTYLGVTKFSERKHGEALECFRKAADLGRDDARPPLRLGEALLRLGRPEEAEAALREALRRERKGPYAEAARKMLEDIAARRPSPEASLPQKGGSQ